VRAGVRIGIDVGDVRVGVARSDATGTLAVPLQVLRRGELGRLAALVREYEAVEVLVGLPLTLAGVEGTAAAKARAFAMAVQGLVEPVPVRLVDERLSTVTALRAMRANGTSAAQGRQRVDAAAAAVIVQTALDAERTTGEPPGIPL
jgi:putative Holliday junction resolvase